jgi:hypothetical protein
MVAMNIVAPATAFSTTGGRRPTESSRRASHNGDPVIGPAEVILILIVAALLFAPEILKALWDSLK